MEGYSNIDINERQKSIKVRAMAVSGEANNCCYFGIPLNYYTATYKLVAQCNEWMKNIFCSIFYEFSPHCVCYVPYRNEWMEKICHKKKYFSHYYYCYYFPNASEAVKITKWFLSAFPLGIFLIQFYCCWN